MTIDRTHDAPSDIPAFQRYCVNVSRYRDVLCMKTNEGAGTELVYSCDRMGGHLGQHSWDGAVDGPWYDPEGRKMFEDES